MTALLAPLIGANFTSAANFDEFFKQQRDRTTIRSTHEMREQPPMGAPGESCKTILFFGFFFDGTRNNYEQAEATKSNLNVARLYDCFPGLRLASMESNSLAGTVAIGSLIFLSVTLGTAIGFSAASPRTTVNVRALAGATFVLGLAVQLVFAFGWFSQTVYVVTTGTLFLIFILAANALHDVRH